MKELIKELYKDDKKFKKDILDELRKDKENASKYLLEELKQISKDIDNKKIDYAPLMMDYALFLLAEFRCKELFPILIELFNKEEIDDAFNFYGDGILDKIPSIVVSVFNNDFKSLNKIIETKKLDYLIRERFLNSYIYFFDYDMISKDDLIKYLRKLIKLYNYDDRIYDGILDVIINAHLFEMIDDVKLMFRNDVIDYRMRGGYDSFIDDIFNYNDAFDKFDMIDNVEKVMSWWACFEKNDYFQKKYNKVSEKLTNHFVNDIKDNLVNYNKIGRNDPCPCGSGKKYKKCCLGKNGINVTLSYQKYIDKSLSRYPKKNNNKDEVDFYTFYNEEYIKIDELLYKVLRHKEIPLFIKRDEKAENEIDFKYLTDAYELIKEVILNNNFKDIDEYDNKVSIHYSLYNFFSSYTELIINNIHTNKDKYLPKLEEVVDLFYDNFEFNDEREDILLDRCNSLYHLSHRYKEGIEFFLDKLNTYKGYLYDVYGYLFDCYMAEYDYDKGIKMIDDEIEKVKDKELKSDLEELKLEFIDEYDYQF